MTGREGHAHLVLTPTRSSSNGKGSGSNKRGRRVGACPALPSMKRLRLQSPERKGGSVVPETPEKKEVKGQDKEEEQEEKRTPRLCNISSLLHRLDPGAKITNFQVYYT